MASTQFSKNLSTSIDCFLYLVFWSEDNLAFKACFWTSVLKTRYTKQCKSSWVGLSDPTHKHEKLFHLSVWMFPRAWEQISIIHFWTQSWSNRTHAVLSLTKLLHHILRSTIDPYVYHSTCFAWDLLTWWEFTRFYQKWLHLIDRKFQWVDYSGRRASMLSCCCLVRKHRAIMCYTIIKFTWSDIQALMHCRNVC